ncbi:Nicotinate-nucleotide adenylyltransferase [hydrothermal vent metagenome]|uniref:Nicotinate-nucleotide adenylyltransferase n=1 Tax=hydrothermal vent metagenome TaxID=652676 RepID=A0A3B0TLI6_9ZZZZ
MARELLKIRGITDLPHSEPGMRIGLFGGSFNPPHQGHRMVSRQALKRLDLDAVWWLVTPGNPLKDFTELAPLKNRVLAARQLVDHPRVKITGFEASRGFRFTYDTLGFLRRTLPERKFVWIMGADSFVSFHLWEHWRRIASLMPLAIYARPGSSRLAPFSKAAIALARYRIKEKDATILPSMPAPAWVYLNGMMSSLSSKDIRKSQKFSINPKKSGHTLV